MNARKEIHCEFTGVSAHAGGNPWDGVNALDALVGAYSNMAMLRQQMKPDERVHCAFLDTPKVANIIPAFTKAYWQIRSPSLKGLNALMARARKCIEAGASASGCEVKIVEYVLSENVLVSSPSNECLTERSCMPISKSMILSVPYIRLTWAPTGAMSLKPTRKS